MIGIAANLDNLGIGVTLGSRRIYVPLLSNLIIAILSMIATFLSMVLGEYISGLLPTSWGNMIGGMMIVILGIWGIISYQRKRGAAAVKKNGNNGKDKVQRVSWLESISLGSALSINCMASSLGAGASGVSPYLTALSVGVFSFVMIDIGSRMGIRFARSWLGKYSELIGCVLLIAIGCYEMTV
ncbi:protein of unknown function DUF204 [Paenibacillus curdlanolyticus YK9]|uniref:Sporulation protein YtaF n=2 Tax=Paenibacillus curdlanolyticus TaxID=59840 RepID=E0I8B6_9BACL|nr:protein of unknown function DUF204 [Paenibacillus curdlanolyticus YK9]